MDAEQYCRRIGYRGRGGATWGALRELHLAHLYAVPFENLDIPLGRTISLSLPAIYEKVVTRRRGGFCYELNGLFAWLLKEIGFEVEMLSGRVFGGGGLGPEFDHMALLVDLGEPVLADVGFGDSFLEPLPLDNRERRQGSYLYRLLENGENWTLQRRKPEEPDWEPQYRFSLRPRQLSEFAPMCHYQQTSPESVFTKKSVCSKATPDGRITLSNGRLIMTANETREERRIESVQEYRGSLKHRFGMELEPELDLSRLLPPNSSPRVR